MYTYHEELPPPEKYNELREIVGWGSLDKKVVEKSLPTAAMTTFFLNDCMSAIVLIDDFGLDTIMVGLEVTRANQLNLPL